MYKNTKKVETKKKEMCKMFMYHKLPITIEANKKVVDVLDLTLDLRTDIYKPNKSPNINI